MNSLSGLLFSMWIFWSSYTSSWCVSNIIFYSNSQRVFLNPLLLVKDSILTRVCDKKYIILFLVPFLEELKLYHVILFMHEFRLLIAVNQLIHTVVRSLLKKL